MSLLLEGWENVQYFLNLGMKRSRSSTLIRLNLWWDLGKGGSCIFRVWCNIWFLQSETDAWFMNCQPDQSMLFKFYSFVSIQDFLKVGSNLWVPKAWQARRVWGLSPPGNFKTWNVGDAISWAFRVNLRQKRGFERTHRTPPRSATDRLSILWEHEIRKPLNLVGLALQPAKYCMML